MKIKTIEQLSKEIYTNIDGLNYNTYIDDFEINIIPILIYEREKLEKMIKSDIITQYNFYYKHPPVISEIPMASGHWEGETIIKYFISLKILSTEEQKQKLRKQKLKKLV